ncbi:AMP-binding protein [Chloroflexi bacterium TSY]|nr:AMP-binding protein [Chloroflexi bacterium TSY]
MDVYSFVDLLCWRAENQPDQIAYRFLVDDTGLEENLTYAELDRQARSIATRLQQIGTSGERALLLYPPSLSFIAAYFGCLYAGIVAVPVYPPRRNRPDQRLRSIIADSGATIALTTQGILSSIENRSEHMTGLDTLQWQPTDTIPVNLATEWQTPNIDQNSLAFLQYTSGSTAMPKGVMVSHGNLLHNSAMIYRSFEHTAETRGLVWTPFYHDMGLIGGVLQPLFGGFPVMLMSPISFLQKPLRWLQAISHHKITSSGGPNFAYEFCLNKISAEERQTLDLSSWEIAFSGAEPVRADTLEKFARAFEPCGFRRKAFHACYGLAEATLMVSGASKNMAPPLRTVDSSALTRNRIITTTNSNAKTIVGCGQCASDQTIAIVDPQSHIPCASGQVGEIWVTGPSIAQGYWRAPDETAKTFHARIRNTDENRYLRTGDLGFMQNGELYVTGRLKDMIVVRGCNYYPQDIELSVERSHGALRPGCGAAFSIEIEGDERLVVVQEVKRTEMRGLNMDEVVGAIRKAVSEEHGLQLYAVRLLKVGRIPKTSSGKIQRHACQDGFFADTLDTIGGWQSTAVHSVNLEQDTPSNPTYTHTEISIQHWMVNWLANKLEVAPNEIEPSKPFAEYGLDSVTGVELTRDLQAWLQFPTELEETLAWDFPTIEAVSQHLARESKPVEQPSTVQTQHKQIQHRHQPHEHHKQIESSERVASDTSIDASVSDARTQKDEKANDQFDELIIKELVFCQISYNTVNSARK